MPDVSAAAALNVLILVLLAASAGWALYELVAWVARRQARRVLDERDFADLRQLLSVDADHF